MAAPIENGQRRVGISTADLPAGSRPKGPWRLRHGPTFDFWVRLFVAPDGTLYGAGVVL